MDAKSKVSGGEKIVGGETVISNSIPYQVHLYRFISVCPRNPSGSIPSPSVASRNRIFLANKFKPSFLLSCDFLERGSHLR